MICAEVTPIEAFSLGNYGSFYGYLLDSGPLGAKREKNEGTRKIRLW